MKNLVGYKKIKNHLTSKVFKFKYEKRFHEMMNNSKEEFVLYKGIKIEIKNGELRLPHGLPLDLEIKSFDEIEGLETLTNLKKLHYKDAFYLRKIEKLDRLQNLEYLILKNCPHLSKIENLDNLTNLKLLDLTDSNISIIENLDHLTNLEVLRLRKSLETSCSDYITEITGLENLPNLKELDLGGNRIKVIKGLETLTNLKILYLTFNQIREIKGLDNLSNLEELYLAYNKITEIKGLDNLSNLKILRIQYNTPFNSNSIKILESMRRSGIDVSYFWQ